MNNKRLISIAIIIVQLFALSSCRETVTFDEHYSEVVYTDEEFFGVPEIIVRATAEKIENEYFTTPDGKDYENAHITVYNMKISEIYFGTMETETFQLKLFNGKGMSPELYLYGKDDQYILEEKAERFLLNIGQEYILGLTFLDPQRYNCYNDPGGWAIQHGKTWTFIENEKGLYENLDQGVNHKEIDIDTLKNKIETIR